MAGGYSISVQDAVWYASLLGKEFQSTSRILPTIEVIHIGDNATYTGQYLDAVRSNIVGNNERPVFQTPQIQTFRATVSAYEAPVFISDVELSNLQFGGEVAGRVMESIGAELGRRADKIFIATLNANYDPDNTIHLEQYYNVQGLSQGRNMLGERAATGRIINLIDYEIFNNLLLDQRFSNWLFNDTRPLAEEYPQGNLDVYMNYQGMLMIKLAGDVKLPKSSGGAKRSLMFTTDSAKFILGSVAPYGGLYGSLISHQVHRGGFDINTRIRMSGLVERKEGIIAIESFDGYRPQQAA